MRNKADKLNVFFELEYDLQFNFLNTIGTSFPDVDECNASIPVCDVNADCKNTRGSYRCSCKTGFTGDGKTCTGKRAAE